MYFGLSLNVGTFGMDIYVTQFIFGAVELPARLGSLPLIQRFGRRICEASLLMVGGVACLVILVIPKGKTLLQKPNESSCCCNIAPDTFSLCLHPSDLPAVVTVIAGLGKFASTGCFSVVYVYTAELYPTTLR